jgi:dTDP-4-dehydrorhamnose reductase
MVAVANPRHLVIRSSGLYGTATSRKGWTFPELMINKARTDGKLKVVTDQALSPTYTHDLAAATRMLMERDATGIFNLTNGGECSWHEFASATLELAGIDVEIEPAATVQQPRKAVRPAYSAMESVRLGEFGLGPLRPWREALEHYLEAKGIVGN